MHIPGCSIEFYATSHGSQGLEQSGKLDKTSGIFFRLVTQPYNQQYINLWYWLPKFLGMVLTISLSYPWHWEVRLPPHLPFTTDRTTSVTSCCFWWIGPQDDRSTNPRHEYKGKHDTLSRVEDPLEWGFQAYNPSTGRIKLCKYVRTVSSHKLIMCKWGNSKLTTFTACQSLYSTATPAMNFPPCLRPLWWKLSIVSGKKTHKPKCWSITKFPSWLLLF